MARPSALHGMHSEAADEDIAAVCADADGESQARELSQLPIAAFGSDWQAAEPEPVTAPASPHPDERAQSRREHTENPQSGHREWSPCAHSPSQHGRGASTNRLELSVAALEKEREVKRAESTRRRKLVHAQSEPAVDLSARPGTRRADSLHLAGPRNNNWLSRNEMSGWTLQEGPLTVLFGISFSPHVGHQSRLMHPDSPFIILCTAISCCLLIYVLIVV